MAERYGVGENRPEAQGKVCGVCIKQIHRGYSVFLGEKYYHAKCFFKAKNTGATEQQVRYLRAAYESVKIFSPMWRKIRNAN
jgi:hypothetical protein